jgi:hypothetical protein
LENSQYNVATTAVLALLLSGAGKGEGGTLSLTMKTLCRVGDNSTSKLPKTFSKLNRIVSSKTLTVVNLSYIWHILELYNLSN